MQRKSDRKQIITIKSNLKIRLTTITGLSANSVGRKNFEKFYKDYMNFKDYTGNIIRVIP